jgi:hypothetical protein
MKLAFIDPPSAAFDEGRIFDIENTALNRDDGLLAYYNLKKDFESEGYTVETFDQHEKFSNENLLGAIYISFSRKRDPEVLSKMGLRLFAYYLMEPPLVDPKMYAALPVHTKFFENVFVHNLTGDCYNLTGVDKSKLRKLFWPQPKSQISQSHWEKKNRFDKVVLINGHHKPKGFSGRELYSERIKWAVKLTPFIEVDLFGRGWDKLSRSSLWFVYLFNLKTLKKIYKGPCASKLDTMSQYKFSLCFENLIMDGYITEKIFDCFYCGTIPIYWGGSDIEKWIPANCYIDMSKFTNPRDLSNFLKKISEVEIEIYKKNAKEFLTSDKAKGYFDIFLSLKSFLNRGTT